MLWLKRLLKYRPTVLPPTADKADYAQISCAPGGDTYSDGSARRVLYSQRTLYKRFPKIADDNNLSRLRPTLGVHWHNIYMSRAGCRSYGQSSSVFSEMPGLALTDQYKTMALRLAHISGYRLLRPQRYGEDLRPGLIGFGRCRYDAGAISMPTMKLQFLFDFEVFYFRRGVRCGTHWRKG